MSLVIALVENQYLLLVLGLFWKTSLVLVLYWFPEFPLLNITITSEKIFQFFLGTLYLTVLEKISYGEAC